MSISHVHYPPDEKVAIANIKIQLVQAFASQLLADAKKSYTQVSRRQCGVDDRIDRANTKLTNHTQTTHKLHTNTLSHTRTRAHMQREVDHLGEKSVTYAHTVDGDDLDVLATHDTPRDMKVGLSGIARFRSWR